MTSKRAEGIVERYLTLGLSVGRHIPGFVDAYYGPSYLQERVGNAELQAPDQLLVQARSILGAIDGGEPLGDPTDELDTWSTHDHDAVRRRWIRSQLIGVLTSIRVLSGETIGYADEVESCYGVRPSRVPDDLIVEAHRELDRVVPGSGSLADRLIAWRAQQAIPLEVLDAVIHSIAEDLQERTTRLFGLPDGESVEFMLVRNEPWSGFNYYLGGFRSKVAINIDLPVLSTAIGHLVADEAYPGHHTEHSRKEAGLVRQHRFWEESIFLVGTPQCLISEGLADLGLEVVAGRRPEPVLVEHLRANGVAYDPETVAVIAQAAEMLSAARANAAFRLHEDGADPEVVIDEVAQMALLDRPRAARAVEFLLDPTWRSYISCYVEGLPLCRRFVSERPEQFARLISEQLIPADLLGSWS